MKKTLKYIFFLLSITSILSCKAFAQENVFTDVNSSQWAEMSDVKAYNDKANFGGYHECIAVVSFYKIMNGYDDGCFHPEYSITRAELCAVIDRAFGNLLPGEIYNSSQVYNIK